MGFNHIKNNTLPLIMILASLGACGDKSTEDVQREKVAEQVGRIQANAGDYQGIIYRQGTQNAVGGLEINFTATTGVVPATATTEAYQRAVAQGQLLFRQGGNTYRVPFSDAYYSSETDSFQITINVISPSSMVAGQSETQIVDIVAGFRNGKLEGTIYVHGFDQLGGTFSLAKDSHDAVNFQDTGSAPVTNTQTYRSSPIASSSDEPNNPIPPGTIAQLQIVHARRTDAGQLLEAFSSIVPLQATITIVQPSGYQVFSVTFTNATWDQREGTLIGSSQYSGNNTQYNLECHELELGSRPSKGWDCQFLNSRGGLLMQAQMRAGN